jgi:hypothetical protein
MGFLRAFFVCLLIPLAAHAEVTRDALIAHGAELAKKVTGKHLSVLIEPPFVLIGDGGDKKLREHARTVRWTDGLLREDFFPHGPNRVIEIWLFETEKSYLHGAKEYFGDSPDTPFGYYSPAHDALIMNVGSGGGTLVHELVHAYMEANFPEVPAWFNEGLASLYERPTDAGGKISGLPNWRLPALQKEIKGGKGRSIVSLVSTTTDEFYGAKDETYARARYLLYYLQEKGLLVDYYNRFHDHHDEDPTGLKTLRAVLETEDLDGFEKKWDVFVLGLKVP